tara:strand:+ start:452 stop:928 length:477 start_codon:yes stop_codon:yes gene_type:complete
MKKLKIPDSIKWESSQSGWILDDLEATIKFGEALSKNLAHVKILLLEGPLGAGKTSLIKGIGKGLGINEPITSPSFGLAHHYLNSKRTLFHLDLYRLEQPAAANEFFYEEEEEANDLKALMVIEWPSRLSINLHEALYIKLKYLDSGGRLIQVNSKEY